MGHVLGVDIGGTFTDFSLVDEQGRITLWKEASTPKDPAQGIKTGLANLAKALGLSLAAFLDGLDLFVHGSTIATNTVIQRNGPVIGLICTEGFRDVIFLRNGFKPERFNWNLKPPEDFVPRYLRLGVKERLDYRGNVVTPLDADSVRTAAKALKAENVKAVAVALLWSIVNPEHERLVKRLVEQELPGVPVVLSSDVLPAIREWERTCATLLSAYLLPGIAAYLQELERFLKENGLRRPLLIIQLNGGCASVEAVLQKPIYALASGPAAGPAAALHCAKRENLADVIAVDMGGTSFDVCMVTGGQASMTKEMRVEDMPVGVAAVDVHSIGAGGGSIAWVDKGGALHVGPQSAGADPGPACYAQGGTQPTVTDANVVLGYINPDYFLGGRRKIDPVLSRAAIERAVAKPLGISVEEAAQGIFRLVNNNMISAIRAVSVERGIDPRNYAMVVGGGAGAIHAAKMAADLGMKKAIIPRYAGVFCSYGMVVSDVKHDHVKTMACNSERLDVARINALYAELEARARAELEEEGFAPVQIELRRYADAKYPSQVHELTVPVPSKAAIDAADMAQVLEAFHALHERMFTYCVRQSSVDFFHWGVSGIGRAAEVPAEEMPLQTRSVTSALKAERPVLLENGFAPTLCYDGSRLVHGMTVDGPAIIEQENTTVVLFKDQKLAVNRFGDFIVRL